MSATNHRYVPQPNAMRPGPPPANGAIATSAPNTSDQHTTRSGKQSGKFLTLTDFAIPQQLLHGQTGNNTSTRSAARQQSQGSKSVEYETHADRNLYLRDIVHIREEEQQDSRINNRVMLVLRKTDDSFTCLQFCRHPEATFTGKYHSPVTTSQVQAGASARTSSEALPAVQITLLDWNDTAHEPQQHIFLDLRGTWNVETAGRITFAKLGYINVDCWEDVRIRAAQIFAKSLKVPWPPSTNDSQSSRQPVVTIVQDVGSAPAGQRVRFPDEGPASATQATVQPAEPNRGEQRTERRYIESRDFCRSCKSRYRRRGSITKDQLCETCQGRLTSV